MDNTSLVVLVLLDMKAAGMNDFIKTFGPLTPSACWNAVEAIRQTVLVTGINATCAVLEAVK